MRAENQRERSRSQRGTGRMRRWRLVAVGVVLAAAAVVAPQSASALPPDGPSPNTPGTYVEVWPTSVKHGEVLNFRVSGFPAGEIIHLKYDDGDASVCGSSAVHGACVIHTQVVPSSGVTVGSVVIPADLPLGGHWLRFLASSPVAGGGVLGFTLHGQGGGYGNSNFTVIAGGTGGAPAGAAAPGQTTGEAGSAQSTTGAGATAKAVVGDVATTEPQRDPEAPAASGGDLPVDARGVVTASVDGGSLTISVDAEYAHEWMFVFAYSEPVGLGWQQVAGDGTLLLPLLDLEPGQHRFAVVNEDGELVGWTEADIDDALVAEAQQLATGAPLEGETAERIPWIGIGAVAAAVVAAAAILWLTLRRARATRARATRAGAAESGMEHAGAVNEAADHPLAGPRES